MTDLYVCPTTGETESLTLGGFDVCCNHPKCPGNRTTRPAQEDGEMDAFARNVYDGDYIQCLNLYEDVETGELIATLTEESYEIRLTPAGVRDLRIALQAYERKLKNAGKA